MEQRLRDAPDGQVSLTDPDARSMATSGRGTGVVGYNVQTAVDAKHHLIVAHEVTNVGNDRTQLASMAQQAREAMGIESLKVVADRGYFKGEEILACEQAGITTYVPKPLTSNSKADGRFGKQDFVYVPEKNEYRCPAGQSLIYRYTNLEAGLTTHAYWTSNCQQCAIKAQCTNLSIPARAALGARGRDRCDAATLDREPERMRQRRQTVEHPFGTIKHWMGSTHFLTKTIERVSTEMSLHVLAYNLKRVMSVLGIAETMKAMQSGEGVSLLAHRKQPFVGLTRKNGYCREQRATVRQGCPQCAGHLPVPGNAHPNCVLTRPGPTADVGSVDLTATKRT